MWLNEGASRGQDRTALEPGNQMLLRQWEAFRAGRTAPRRGDLDLRQMRRLLPGVFIAEKDDFDGYIWRLAGTGICHLFRREMTGRDFLDGWMSFERGVITRFLTGVTEDHRQVSFRLRLQTDRGQTLHVEMLALPLTAADGVATHVLGGFSPLEDSQIKIYGAIIAMELASARFLSGLELMRDPARAIEARRQFRMIEGGLSPR